MNPKELDAAINGLKVFINARADGTLYATHHDFSKFNVKPVKTIRVPLAEVGADWTVDTCPHVAQALAELNQ